MTEVKCMHCGKIWESLTSQDFLATCGVCAKKLTDSFEAQMNPRLLGASKHIKVEGK